jgi:glycosyltransferase involved in cell wall biosynthesis
MKLQFSIIIPTLNEEKFLPVLLQSLATQTDTSFEVIVVDGSSQDGTISIAEQYKKILPKLQVVVSQKASLPLQRNLGARQASAGWLCFVDADSVLMPYFIERALVYVKQFKPSAFTTWAKPDSDISGDAIFTLFMNVYVESSVHLKRPLTPGPLTAIRKDIFTRIGGYNEEHAYNEDAEFGLRLSLHGVPVSLLRETLYVWSLRRIRHEGKLKVVQKWALGVLPILFKRPLKHMPGYDMGGHLYEENRQSAQKNKPKAFSLKKFISDIVGE